MDDYSEAFVGIDTSKLRNAVAIADAGRGGEVRFLGEIETTPAATAKLVRKLAAKYKRLTFCYEAGPTGYGLHRQIKGLGFECTVVAPSLIPKRPGDKVKTNRRDALSLAKLLRADELTPVWVPDGRHEAMRDLTRARETAMLDLRTKRQHVSAFLLRLGRPYPEGKKTWTKKTWTKAHLSWIAGQKLEHPQQRLVLEEMMLAIRQAQERLARLEQAIAAAVPEWSLAPVVTALMAMRGMDMISATTLLAEIGDLSRFRTPSELMAYLGLVPSEDSTGDAVKRGPITKAGNRRAHAGGVLMELSASAAGRTSQATEGRCGAASGSRDCLEGAVPAVPALSYTDQERQAQDRRHRRDRPRTRRLHLGCRSRSHDRTCRGSPGLRGLASTEAWQEGPRRPSANQGARRRGSGPANKSRATAGAEPRQGEFPIILCDRSQDRRPTSDRDSPRRTYGHA
jgi:transposase